MQIGGGEPTNTPDYDALALFMPLQRGTRANTELPPNGRRNRDLPLCSQTGMCNRHASHYRGTATHVKQHSPVRAERREDPMIPAPTTFARDPLPVYNPHPA